MALELLRKNGESRSSMGRHLGVSGNTVVNNLRPDRPRGEHTDPRWMFAIFEHFGEDPIAAMSALCPVDSPEVLLDLLPIPGFDPKEERRRRRTKAYTKQVEFLLAVDRLEGLVPQSPSVMYQPWPVRRFQESSLEEAYVLLEDLEERRHNHALVVSRTCHRAIVTFSERGDLLSPSRAVQLIGMVGIWGSIQRCLGQLEPARNALRRSISLADRLGDMSLRAHQLQRAAYVFRELQAPEVGMDVLRKASELYRGDRNELGGVYTLIDRAVSLGNQGRLNRAERLYRAGLELMPAEASPTFRSMATQGIAVCREMSGDVAGALKFLDTTLAETQVREPRFIASVLLCAANLERKLGNYAAAEEKYWKGLRVLEDVRDPDSKLKLYVDLAVCLIRSDQRHKLSEVKKAAQRFIPKLRHRRAIQQQVEALVRELTAGAQVTVEALEAALAEAAARS